MASAFRKHCGVAEKFHRRERIVVYPGNCLDVLKEIPDQCIQLVVTSPPYNIGKAYEKRLNLDQYLDQQANVIFRVRPRFGLRRKHLLANRKLCRQRIRHSARYDFISGVFSTRSQIAQSHCMAL